jgi:hypothetical protein
MPRDNLHQKDLAIRIISKWIEDFKIDLSVLEKETHRAELIHNTRLTKHLIVYL